MPIQRIESLTYGVEDIATGVRYFNDIGLEQLEHGERGATFRTPVNQTIHLRHLSEASLPAVPESGQTMREIVWGVESDASLQAIGAELSRDREVKATPDGVLHSRDETGFAIAFSLSKPTHASVEPRLHNDFQSTGRLNQRFARVPRLRPLRLAHVVYLIKPEAGEKAAAFYADRLGFRLTDHAPHLGNFLRVRGITDHHSLLLMWIRKVPVRFDHAGFEVRGFDEVVSSGAYMSERGWRGTWGPGRQSLGSHIFWHYENPCGGEVEFFSDMDRFDDTWAPKIWTERPPAAPWMLDEELPQWVPPGAR